MVRRIFVSISGLSIVDPRQKEFIPHTCFGLFFPSLKEKRRGDIGFGLFTDDGRKSESQDRNFSYGLSF